MEAVTSILKWAYFIYPGKTLLVSFEKWAKLAEAVVTDAGPPACTTNLALG
jgi:hypothetical protein